MKALRLTSSLLVALGLSATGCGLLPAGMGHPSLWQGAGNVEKFAKSGGSNWVTQRIFNRQVNRLRQQNREAAPAAGSRPRSAPAMMASIKRPTGYGLSLENASGEDILSGAGFQRGPAPERW